MKRLAIFTLIPAPALWLLERFHIFSLVLVAAVPLALILAIIVFFKTKEDKTTKKLAKISIALNLIALLLLVAGAVVAIQLRETVRQHPEWLQQSEQPSAKK